MRTLLVTLIGLFVTTTVTAGPPADGTIRIATWNIENWNDHFQAFRDKDLPEPATEEGRERRRQERFQNGEDNWEVAVVLLDPDFAPDILLTQEGCSQEELDHFAQEWEEVGQTYPTRVVFPGNSGRGQMLQLLMRDGFRIIKTNNDLHLVPDTRDLNPRSDRLFGRGPAFVLVETPDGDRFWVGTTHQKSKGGNSIEVTQWRMAEATTTHALMVELAKEAPVFLLGDMNDEIGFQEYELPAGGDVMAALAGLHNQDAGDDFVIVTRDLAMQGVITYSGYWRDRFRSFIDHIVADPAGAKLVKNTDVFDNTWVRVASDHVPVYIDVVPTDP
ncbi:MAG: endonuclease/exonuclease/phosphatase family protein [Planctomycetota bacterium]